MKPDKKQEAQRWLRQAEYELASARHLLAGEHFAIACFMSQQATEKALKALAYFRGDRYVLGHSLVELLSHLTGGYPDLAAFRQRAGKLDRYYLPTRYPDALPGGVPAEGYDASETRDAVAVATDIVALAHRLIEGG